MSDAHSFLKVKELAKSSWFHRLFGLVVKKNALIEVNNLLATKPISEIDLEQIAVISQKYKLDCHGKFRNEFKSLYQKYLEFSLRDRHLSDEELSNLKALQELLAVRDSMARRIFRDTVNDIYNLALDDVLMDGKIDEHEKMFLKGLRENLQIPAAIADKAYTKKAEMLLQKSLTEAIADRMLSPQEEEEINSLAKRLNIDFNFSNKIKAAELERMRLYWMIAHGDIPVIDPGIRLFKGENCFFTRPANWCEMRSVTKRIRYGGPMLRIKIAKGLYYRAADYAVSAVKEDVLAPLDSGSVFFTSKRVIFTGRKGSKNIRLNRILDFEPYSDGLEIIKDSGKNPVIRMDEDADLAAMILARLLGDIE
jgi:Chloroplast envelope transporter